MKIFVVLFIVLCFTVPVFADQNAVETLLQERSKLKLPDLSDQHLDAIREQTLIRVPGIEPLILDDMWTLNRHDFFQDPLQPSRFKGSSPFFEFFVVSP